jgi:arginase family enzyme
MIQKLDLNIVGLDLVEYNPDRDLKGVTAMTAAKIVKELLAKLL